MHSNSSLYFMNGLPKLTSHGDFPSQNSLSLIARIYVTIINFTSHVIIVVQVDHPLRSISKFTQSENNTVLIYCIFILMSHIAVYGAHNYAS